MAEDGSPQRGPSGQPECSEIWLTEPEVTDEETIEDQNKVEQQECGNRRCCDLSKNSTTPTKHPKDGRYLAKRGGIRLQAQTPRTSVTQGRWSKGRYICNVSIGVLVTCAWRTAQKCLETWLFGAYVTVVTYHNPRKFLTLTSSQSARLVRWALELLWFDVTDHAQKGKLHANKNTLPRLASPHLVG
ncbi:hypothetical protein MRX96_012707 [Rhipicephalus microplus]